MSPIKRKLILLIAATTAGLPAVSHAADRFNSERHAFKVETVARGLNHPWGMAFLPDGDLLVTERAGRLRLFTGARFTKIRVIGVPKVRASGQGGLLDVAIDPDFANNNLIYLSYSEPGSNGNGTAVMRALLVRTSERAHLAKQRVIFRMNQPNSSTKHYGSRLVFAPDGTLFVTVGERGGRERAQDPFDHAGSVVRIRTDGRIPKGNPFSDGNKGAPEIWSIGHRNPQGAALNPKTGKLWTVEHGARGGDEINIPQAGKNYGWPEISYGRHYWGGKIGRGTKAPGMEQPVYYWDPSIAPSGMAFYDKSAFKNWRGNLFIGALRSRMLVRLELYGDKVVREERLLKTRYGRIRDVRVGPKGAIWLLTDQRNGKLLRLTPE